MKTNVCLVSELTQLFHRHDPQVASRWEAVYGRDKHRCVNLHPHGQMHLINSFWRLQLGLLNSMDTFRCRQAIVDDIDIPMWLHNYEKYVLPVISANGLPNMEPLYGHIA